MSKATHCPKCHKAKTKRVVTIVCAPCEKNRVREGMQKYRATKLTKRIEK